MWRFILISFVFMGWAFYQLSGGSDYEPSEGSLQNPVEVAKLDGADKTAPAATDIKVASNDATEVKSDAQGDKVIELVKAVETTDETAGADTPAAAGENSSDEESEVTYTEVQFETAIDAFKKGGIKNEAVKAVQQPATAAGADIRKVKGNRVNLRSGPGKDFAPVDNLANGAEVEVIAKEGEWVQLRVLSTGVTGWMADWLITAANE